MREVDFWAKHYKDAKRAAVGTVGWVLPTPSFGIDKPSEFGRSMLRFVSGFCI
jgi:hypothetical protein